jgi:hypothetical protein
MHEKPDDFDWVKARTECSIYKTFKDLQRRVEADVAQRNETASEEEKKRGITFHCKAEGQGGDYFVVTATRKKGIVRFFLRDEKIQVVSDDVNATFEATITLNNEGDCRLKVNGQELQTWQFLRMALEEMLFD